MPVVRPVVQCFGDREPTASGFDPPAVITRYGDKPYDAAKQVEIYGGKRNIDEPRPIIEIGRPLYREGPLAGGYNCRAIAGTVRLSAHATASAIDLPVTHADYWRWTKPNASNRYAYRNSFPPEVVRVFEKHGFIWGGKWYHYDTMHFEYRPEILAASKP